MASLSAAMNFEHGDGDEDYLPNGNESFATNHRHMQELQRLSAFQQVTTKVPPPYDGRSSWFAYEDAIDDWCDITELDGDKRGPALRNRLEGEAAMHKRLLDRDRLKDPNNGVKYFKSFLRPLFVKGAANVFLYRFQQFMNLHRGNGDMLRWITRFQLSVQRMQEAWNDTYPADHGPYGRRGPSFHRRFTRRRTRNHHERRGDGESQRTASRPACTDDLDHGQPRCTHLCVPVRPHAGSATGVDFIDGTSEPCSC